MICEKQNQRALKGLSCKVVLVVVVEVVVVEVVVVVMVMHMKMGENNART